MLGFLVSAYICAGELLLGTHYCSGPLCCIELTLALDRCLTLCGARSSDLAADLRHGVPVVTHLAELGGRMKSLGGDKRCCWVVASRKSLKD